MLITRSRVAAPRDSLRYQLLSLTTKAKILTQNLGPLFSVASWFGVVAFGVSSPDFQPGFVRAHPRRFAGE